MSTALSSPTPDPEATVQVPLPDVTRFVRQLSHDLRNHLNAVELQSAYLGEIAPDAEMKEEVKRLRAMLSEMGASLQAVTQALADIRLTLMPYEASAFFEDLRAKISSRFPDESSAVEWKLNLGNDELEIDPQALEAAFVELFANAFLHERGPGSLQATAEMESGNVLFTLTEPKSAFTGEIARWGRQPFVKMKHGHYGLGLLRARSIIEAHHGQLHAHYDSASSALVTKVVLSLGPSA
ncbi:MAG: hypothetical protein ABI992_12340 [Chthoniobacterales bacterium]